MDKFIYISSSGANETLKSLAIRSNNLANANSVGFKADFEQAKSEQAYGDGLPTRVFAVSENPGKIIQLEVFKLLGGIWMSRLMDKVGSLFKMHKVKKLIPVTEIFRFQRSDFCKPRMGKTCWIPMGNLLPCQCRLKKYKLPPMEP